MSAALLPATCSYHVHSLSYNYLFNSGCVFMALVCCAGAVMLCRLSSPEPDSTGYTVYCTIVFIATAV